MKNESLKSVIQIMLSVFITLLIIVAIGDKYLWSEYRPNNSLVNINTASIEELKTLPYIGDTLADRIVANRPYYDKKDIAKVKGIGEDTLTEITERIEV